MTRRDGMTIRELEKRSGVKRSTIHHYVRFGLLHKPFKTGQTMAYYDQGHLRELETIQKIKLDFLRTSKASRVPMDYIMHRMTEGYTFAKGKRAVEKRSRRSTQKRAQEKRGEIIEATLRLYADRGYYLTNIRDIAREVGMSTPTFYHYFPDKRELFVEVIEYVVRNYKQEAKEMLDKEDDRVKRTIIMFEVFSKHYPKIGEVLNQLRAGAVVGDQWSRERLSRLYGEMTKDVSEEIRAAIKLGVIRDVDPDLLAFFNVLLDEIAVHRASVDDRYSARQIMLFIADMLYHAFLTKKGKEIFGVFDRSNV